MVHPSEAAMTSTRVELLQARGIDDHRAIRLGLQALREHALGVARFAQGERARQQQHGARQLLPPAVAALLRSAILAIRPSMPPELISCAKLFL